MENELLSPDLTKHLLDQTGINRCLEFGIPIYALMVHPVVRIKHVPGMRLQNRYYDDFKVVEFKAKWAKRNWGHMHTILPCMLEVDDQGLCARYLNTAVHYPMITTSWFSFWYEKWFKHYYSKKDPAWRVRKRYAGDNNGFQNKACPD